MKFAIEREALLEPLQLVSGVIERRQTLPVLANLLMVVNDAGMTLTGTDQEVELSARTEALSNSQTGEVTLPARKLMEICRSLPEGGMLEGELEGNRVALRSGRFSSHLATLPVVDFPYVEMETPEVAFTIGVDKLARLIDRTSFAMAHQDVRYFFNGMLLEVEGDTVRAVATNGQRLAMSFVEEGDGVDGKRQFIIPRKGVLELGRLIHDGGETGVNMQFSGNHMKAESGKATLITKLIDGTYPDYDRAIPGRGDKILMADRREMREALARTAILSNEMYRNVRLVIVGDKLEIQTNNPLQEEAEETVTVEYNGSSLEIGFNVSYLIDALSVMGGEKVKMVFSDNKSATLISDPEDDKSLYVISPMVM